jgi:hypothetical protein
MPPLDFLTSKLIRRKSQQVWPSEAAWATTSQKGERGEMNNPLEAVIEAHGLERWSQLDAVSARLVQGGGLRTLKGQQGGLAAHCQRDRNGASSWES